MTFARQNVPKNPPSVNIYSASALDILLKGQTKIIVYNNNFFV
jgi:hypothetical protein